MEDILDLYEEAYDIKKPADCFEEKLDQLIGQALELIKASAGHPHVEKTVNVSEKGRAIFVLVEPKGGKRRVKVTERRTKQDFAKCISEIADVHYAEVEKVRLVLDNLNTH